MDIVLSRSMIIIIVTSITFTKWSLHTWYISLYSLDALYSLHIHYLLLYSLCSICLLHWLFSIDSLFSWVFGFKQVNPCIGLCIFKSSHAKGHQVNPTWIVSTLDYEWTVSNQATSRVVKAHNELNTGILMKPCNPCQYYKIDNQIHQWQRSVIAHGSVKTTIASLRQQKIAEYGELRESQMDKQ